MTPNSHTRHISHRTSSPLKNQFSTKMEHPPRMRSTHTLSLKKSKLPNTIT